jgi:hypothetical protein
VPEGSQGSAPGTSRAVSRFEIVHIC